MEATENRFAHLLQPIRELTKNWEIDVASELNDYLEELDEVCITFDGGKTSVNFAEAALLIQGTACIYSKKVELLHSLVYQTLEYINFNKKRRNKEASASEEDDGASSHHHADDMDEFTLLDLEASGNCQSSDCSSTVSVTPLPPESLIPPEVCEKLKLPLISVKGEVLCSQKDFRINQFLPGDEDLILLTLRSAAAHFLLAHHHHPLHPPADSVIQQQQQPAAGDEGDGGGAAEDNMEVDDDTEQVDRHQAVTEARLFRERRQVEGDTQRKGEELLPSVDVWRLHDLYAVVGEDRPFKPGKCYKVPDGLEDRGKRKRRRGVSLQDFRTWFTGTFDPPQQKMKSGPKFTDMNYMYLNTLKTRLKTQRRINRRAGVVVSDEELRRTFLQPEEAGQQQQGEEPVDGFRHADLLGGDDDNSDNEQEVFPDDVPAEFRGGDFISPETHTGELSYEDLVKLRVEQLVVNSQGYVQETALSRRVKDWEDMIRPELVLQEQRPPLDIHEFGDRIVAALGAVGGRRTLSSIVHGLDNMEACKFLLASLQLANDYTVEVDSAAGLEDSLDTMGLTLLSTVRAADRLKTSAVFDLNTA